MKFCTRDPFSLHLTVIELHSHAISFTKLMRKEKSGGGAVHCVVCVHVCMCLRDEGDFPMTSWAPTQWHCKRGSLLCIETACSHSIARYYSYSGAVEVCVHASECPTYELSRKLFVEAKSNKKDGDERLYVDKTE